MCKFCGVESCIVTKKQVLERGPLITNSVDYLVRNEDEIMPKTYHFKSQKTPNSYSATIPVADEPNPHAFEFFEYDELENCYIGWNHKEILEPLKWGTEEEILKELSPKPFH